MLCVVVWIGYTLYFGISIGQGDGWTELSYFVISLAVGAVGAVIGGIGRAQAGR